MEVLQTRIFERQVKRLHINQKREVEIAIRKIILDPNIGEAKKGDLKGVRVYKFRVVNQLTLLAYEVEQLQKTLILLAIGTHENFYRDLK